MFDNASLNHDRNQIKNVLLQEGNKGMVISGALASPIFVKNDTGIFEIIGINASFMGEKYVEIFITVDIGVTMTHFDGTAVKASYFDETMLNSTFEISDLIAREGYQRADWRRLQKYVEKNKKHIVTSQQKNAPPPSMQSGM